MSGCCVVSGVLRLLWVSGVLLWVSGMLLLRIGRWHKQIQPIHNPQPHPIIIRKEIVHDTFDHFSVRGAPHTPYEALCQRVEFLVAQEGEVFEFLGGVVGFGALGAREGGVAVCVEEGVQDCGGGEDWEGGYCELDTQRQITRQTKSKQQGTNSRGQTTEDKWRDRGQG